MCCVQALQRQEREEVEWGEVLHVVHSGLVATKRLLWDESERKIIALLSSSSAFEGDHFLQVSKCSEHSLLPSSIEKGCVHDVAALLACTSFCDMPADYLPAGISQNYFFGSWALTCILVVI